MLGEAKLASKFVSASNPARTNSFVRSAQEAKSQEFAKVFDDEKKNQRYWDFVLETEGKKISAQLEILDFE